MGDAYVHDSGLAAVEASSFYDILLIGGGPASLAVAARLFEPVPAALYTEAEHERLRFLRETISKRMAKRNFVKKTPGSKTPTGLNTHWETGDKAEEVVEPRVCVVNKVEGGWLGQWRRQFAAFGIEHLRSPMFFHPAANDLDALIAYAEETGRQQELAEIKDVIGREISKHKQKKNLRGCKAPIGLNQRNRRDYYRPSSCLFQDFVMERVIHRAGLSDNDDKGGTGRICMKKGTVAALYFGSLLITDTLEGEVYEPGVFQIRLDNGSLLGARAVVVGVGNGGQLAVPPVLLDSPSEKIGPFGEGWCHSAALCLPGYQLPAPKSDKDKLLVIGGGLTSAQVVHVALTRGWSKVTLVMRGWLKVKHFDLDLQWVGKYQNLMKAIFWQEECPMTRVAGIREARNGGSVNPDYAHRLNVWEREGKVEIATWTQVTSAAFDKAEGRWTVSLETRMPSKEHRRDAVDATPSPCQPRTMGFRFIVAATGSKLDIQRLPFLEATDFIGAHPPVTPSSQTPEGVDDCFPGGLPWLTHDLQWSPNVPLFFVGAFSGLQIGPGAANLSGARDAAERVVGKLEDMGLGVRRTGKAWKSFSRERFGHAEEGADEGMESTNRWESLGE